MTQRWLRLCLAMLTYVMLAAGIAKSYANDSVSQSVWEDNSRYAINIGIDRYTSSSLPPLQHAVDDAMRFSRVLSEQGYITAQLSNFEVNPEYLLQLIVRIGDELEQTTGRENGTLIITYAGHGFQQDGQNYLAMGDADPSNLEGSALSMNRLKSVLANSGIGRQVLLVDACRNNPARSGSDAGRVFVEDSFEATGLSILYSTSPGQLSHESGTLRQGVFSHFAANALAGAAQTDRQGWVTVNSLFNHVRDQVIRYNNKNGIPSQVPYINGANNGDIRLTQPSVIASRKPGGSMENAYSPDPLAPGSTLKPNTFVLPEEIQTARSLWRVTAAVAGVLVVGALLANHLSDDDGSTQEPGIVVLVPAP